MSTTQSLTSPEVDPTQTYSIRGRLSGRWRGAYGSINSQLETDIVTRDVFGTRLEEESQSPLEAEQLADVPSNPDTGANYNPEAVRDLAQAPVSQQVEYFRQWLDRQQEQGIRGRLSRQHNPYLVQAYNTGIRRAETSLRNADYQIESVAPEDIPRRETTLDEARSRFHDRLTAAINDTTAEAGRELQEGLETGLAATALYKSIKDRINHSRAGKTRARPVAHGEIVRAANGAALDRYELAGAESVGVQVEMQVTGPHEGVPEGVDREDVQPPDEPRGEWATVGDLRVCAQCQTLEGQSWRISDIRSGAAPMPVRDTHSSCRCYVVAV